MYQPVRCEDIASVDRLWLQGKIGHAAASLLDQYDSGRNIPRAQMRLEKRVKAPARNVSQVDGCRAGPSESPCIVHQTAQRGKVTVDTLERAVWEAGGDKRLANVVCSARAAAAAIYIEATPADRCE